MVTLQQLATRLGGTLRTPSDGSVEILTVTSSAQSAPPSSIFVAVRGTQHDGHQFIAEARKNGALAAVVEDSEALGELPGIVVPNCRVALSSLAAFFAGDPSKKLRVVGVTGTNGKTTTHWLLQHLLNRLALPCLRVGTLGTHYPGGPARDGSLTTPDPIALHAIFAEALTAGCKAAVMEVSSHALDQERVAHIDFSVGIFTNLTRDHLDYHGTEEAYFVAKRRLFDLLSASDKNPAIVINRRDEFGERLYREFSGLVSADLSFGRPGSPIEILNWDEQPEGSLLRLMFRGKTIEVRTPLIGMHNAENVAGVFGAATALGLSEGDIARTLHDLPDVPGRLERIPGRAVRVFVDYAHTPDALSRVLQALRPSTTGKLCVVFGCGGDRDRGKRPIMGEVAAKLADRVVVTSDNPRTEAPDSIIDEILSSKITPALVQSDRRIAIREAIVGAAPGDTVLIAGKGHEDYQIIGSEKLHFSDQEEARASLRLRVDDAA